MESTETLRQEHDAVLVVLDQLEFAVQAAERGAPVPADIFTDIGEFFTVFVDQCHHGKEESAVFAKLRDIAGRRVTTSLTDEHQQGRGLAAAYRAATERYVPGEVATSKPLVEAARAYDALLRAHIEEETADLFPLMEALMSERDAEITSEFDRIELEELGAGTHERLHAMIDTLPNRIRPWTAAN